MPARRRFLKALAPLLAVLLLALAFFAPQLGLDNDPGWGRGRYALLAAGLLTLGWAGWDEAAPRLAALLGCVLAPIGPRLPARGGNLARVGHRLREVVPAPAARHLPRLALSLAVALIPLLYLWVLTAGDLTRWPRGSRYFYLLGQAFRHGQLYLLEEPSPELLASPNPYFYKERGEVPVIWDALFYQGKYYLYWGPVPGLIVAALQPLFSEKIRDPALLFPFVLGTFGFNVLLLAAVWRRFGWLPRGMFWGGLLALGLNAPLVWLLTRPKVYEVAIAGGQFFLIGGLYWAFTGLRGRRASVWRLGLAAAFWALAANTRLNLSLSIAFLGLVVAWRIFRLHAREWRTLIATGLAFGLPLLAGAAALMAYNQARFGSPFDFGYRYLITGPTIPEDPSRTASLDYVVPNVYQYLLRPPEVRREFPYVVVPWIKNDMWPPYIRLPRDYFYTEPVASLPLTVPVIGLAGLAALRLGWLHLNGLAPPPARVPREDRGLFAWLCAALGGSALLAFVVLLVFIQNTYRYLVDLSLTTTLLAVLFVAHYRVRARGWPRRLWAAAWGLAALLTPLFGLLIAITGYARAFEKSNPDLYFRMLDWFP